MLSFVNICVASGVRWGCVAAHAMFQMMEWHLSRLAYEERAIKSLIVAAETSYPLCEIWILLPGVNQIAPNSSSSQVHST